jgi:isopentenyldiphosphate isomerase
VPDPAIAQDPDELFDVVTFDGQPTGVVKRRADVHRDGDWHRAIHVWITGIDETGPFLIFQRRGMEKDTHPGKFDATVGGHYGAGETVVEALREVEEEIGIEVALGDLTYVGIRVCIAEPSSGVIDHELQDVFLLRDDRTLTSYRPNPAELAAIVQCPLEPLLGFLAGDRDSIPTRSIAPGSTTIECDIATAEDFILRHDRYSYRVAIAAERLLAGERHIAV